MKINLWGLEGELRSTILVFNRFTIATLIAFISCCAVGPLFLAVSHGIILLQCEDASSYRILIKCILCNFALWMFPALKAWRRRTISLPFCTPLPCLHLKENAMCCGYGSSSKNCALLAAMLRFHTCWAPMARETSIRFTYKYQTQTI